jgi:hypothetical protein
MAVDGSIKIARQREERESNIASAVTAETADGDKGPQRERSSGGGTHPRTAYFLNCLPLLDHPKESICSFVACLAYGCLHATARLKPGGCL